jgi:hypothetical protein
LSPYFKLCRNITLRNSGVPALKLKLSALYIIPSCSFSSYFSLLHFCHICLLLLQLWDSKNVIPQPQLGHIPNALDSFLDKCPCHILSSWLTSCLCSPSFPPRSWILQNPCLSSACSLPYTSRVTELESLSPTHQCLDSTLTAHSNSLGALLASTGQNEHCTGSERIRKLLGNCYSNHFTQAGMIRERTKLCEILRSNQIFKTLYI